MSDTTRTTTTPPLLQGHWAFAEGAGDVAADTSGNGHILTASSQPTWAEGPVSGAGAVKFDGTSSSMMTQGAVVVSDESFSIAAWLRLDSDLAGADLQLKHDWYALTAVAQSGAYHSPFYLGARLIEYGGEGTGDFHLHWNFTVSPIDGSETGPVDWVHAYSSRELTSAELDDWVLVVGVYDLHDQVARLYVPTHEDSGETALPEGWPKWRAEAGLQIGHAWYRDEFVDQWPGSVGPVWAYTGVLTADDAQSLHDRGVLEGE